MKSPTTTSTTNLLRVNRSLLLGIFGWILFGCDNEQQLFVEPGVRSVVPGEIEFTLPTSTVYVDSLRTDNITDAVVGSYTYPELGRVDAQIYTEYDLDLQDFPSGNEDQTLRFDSITLRLRLSSLVTDDVQPLLRLRFRELEDSIFSSALYLADRVLQVGDIVGEDSVLIDRTRDPEEDTVFMDFRLDDAYGQALFDRLITDPSGPNVTSDFLDSISDGLYRFPGLAIEPVEATGLYNINIRAVAGVDQGSDSETRLRVHLSYEEDPDSIFDPIEFALASNRHYTQVNRDRTSSVFDGISDGEAMSSPDGRAYLAPIAGFAPYVDLQPIRDFIDSVRDEVILNRAVLRVTVADESFDPVEFVRYFFADESENLKVVNWSGVVEDPRLNAILDDFEYFSTSPNPLTHSFNEDQYSGSITIFTDGYIQSILEDEVLTDGLLLVSPFSTSIGVSKIEADQVKVEFIYLRRTE